jgi:cytoskeletal protein CcmA (bactofilin family)
MARPHSTSNIPPEAVISIIGAGMTLDGDSETDGSLRVEGTIHGDVRAGKSVVIGKDGLVDGSIFTQDAVVAGRVSGGIHAGSRLELLATSEVSGEIEAPRMQVEEGAKVQGQVAIGESDGPGAFKAPQAKTRSGGGKGASGTEPADQEPDHPEPEELEPVQPESEELEPEELKAAQAERSGD